MALQDYEKFVENPLNYGERYPTIEEFALSFDYFFPLKEGINRTDFEEKSSRIREGIKSKSHRRVVSREEIQNFISCFDLKSLDWTAEDIIKAYIKQINEIMSQGSSKNTYSRSWFRFFFCKAYDLRESTTNPFWISNMPNQDDGDEFHTYIDCLNYDKFKDTLKSENAKKNFSYWKNGKGDTTNFVRIESVLNFLNEVNVNEELIKKESMLANWFYSKCYRCFPCDENEILKYSPNNPLREEASKYTKQMHDLFEKIHNKKTEKDKEEINQEIESFKDLVPPTDYPRILYAEFTHAMTQMDYSKAIELGWVISEIFYYMGSTGASEMPHIPAIWYRPLAVFTAHANYYSDSKKIKTDAGKLLTRLSKYSYLVDFDLDFLNFVEENSFSFENSDVLDKLKNRLNTEFHSLFLPNFFYEKKEISLELTYDINKLNQKSVEIGIKSGYAIELAAQINDVEHVGKIIASGGDVSKSKNGCENALYWAICNMKLFFPIGFWRFPIIPSSGEHLMDDQIMNFIVPKGMKTLKELTAYNKVHAEELQKGRKIYDMVIAEYKSKKPPAPPLVFEEKSNVLHHILLRVGQPQVLSDMIELYGVGNFKTPQDNYFCDILGMYNMLYAYKNGLNTGPKYEPMDRLKNFYKKNLSQGIAEDVSKGCLRSIEVFSTPFCNESSYQFIYEKELLEELKIFIANHFDLCMDIENKTHYFPKTYPCFDSVLFAIEMGWFEAVKLLCDYIQREFVNHWGKMKKIYFSEAKKKIKPSFLVHTKFPSPYNRLLIVKYLEYKIN